MPYDILNVGEEAHRLEAVLREALDAASAPNRFTDGSHLKTANGGRLRLSPAFTDSTKSSVSLHSDLDEAEHNAWAVEVFDAVCAAIDGDVELLDESDHVVKSRHRTAV